MDVFGRCGYAAAFCLYISPVNVESFQTLFTLGGFHISYCGAEQQSNAYRILMEWNTIAHSWASKIICTYATRKSTNTVRDTV
jgi:hypothetical protein